MLLCCNQHSDTARCMHTLCICTYHSDNMCTLHLPTTGNNTVSTKAYACTSTQIYCVLDIRFSCFLQRCKADSECTLSKVCGGIFKSPRCTSLGHSHGNRRATCCSHTWCHITLTSYAFSDGAHTFPVTAPKGSSHALVHGTKANSQCSS